MTILKCDLCKKMIEKDREEKVIGVSTREEGAILYFALNAASR
jgi:hypothetical protein